MSSPNEAPQAESEAEETENDSAEDFMEAAFGSKQTRRVSLIGAKVQ
jgi:hypothetical protein